MYSLSEESQEILEGIKNAGFKSEYNYLKMQNDLGVSLDEFLETIGFEKAIEKQDGQDWVNFKKEGIGFEINYNADVKKKATVDFK